MCKEIEPGIYDSNNNDDFNYVASEGVHFEPDLMNDSASEMIIKPDTDDTK